MNAAASTPSALSRWPQQLWTNCYFKFVLPRIERTTLDGVQLDVSALPLKVRNRILNVGYEESEKEMCRQMLSSSDGVLELGGGIGFVGLFCQLKLGIKKYITVEANPATIAILKQNYCLNNVEPLVWNYAVGQSNGKVSLNVEGDFWEHRLAEESQRAGIVVESITFPSLLAKSEFEITTVIIDIEGAEQHIDFKVLPASVRKIIIEVHPDVLGEQGVQRLVANIGEQGFRTVSCKEATFGFVRG